MPVGLNSRHREVFRLVGEGYTNAEIARRLIISEKYVKNLVSDILAHEGAVSRTELALLARNIIPESMVERMMVNIEINHPVDWTRE